MWDQEGGKEEIVSERNNKSDIANGLKFTKSHVKYV